MDDDTGIPTRPKHCWHLQEACKLAFINTECDFVKDLVLRNRSQHRRADYYQKFVAVHRCAVALRRLQLPEALEDLLHIANSPKPERPRIGASTSAREAFNAIFNAFLLPNRSSCPTDRPTNALHRWHARPKVGTCAGAHQVQLTVPCREAALHVLGLLRTSILLATRMPHLCARACEPLLGQVASSYFVPFCLTAAAVASRVRVLASALLLRLTDTYAQLVTIAAMLPSGHIAHSGLAAAHVYESAHVTWHHGLPDVRFLDFESGTHSFDAFAATLADRHCVRQHASTVSATDARAFVLV
jgi:hypothetical protein